MNTVDLSIRANVLEKLFELRAMLELIKEPTYTYSTFAIETEILQKKGSPVEIRLEYNYKLKKQLITNKDDYNTHYISNVLLLTNADSIEREVWFLKKKFNLIDTDVTKTCFEQYLNTKNKS